MKRYLGIICLLYSGIFGYVVFFDKLKLFLAPGMQIYVKLSIIPMMLIGLVMLFNNKVNYKFKISDLILILPVILLILSGDGKLSISFASNRVLNFNIENKVLSEDTESTKEKSDIDKKTYDFSKPYFEIVDENYVELANYITFAPKASKFEEKTIRVKGFALKMEYLSDSYFALGKYAISCCVADAEFAGFIIEYDNSKVIENKWYEVEGILKKGKDADGYDIMYIKVINIKEMDSSEQYVYPCYAYDNGSCKAVTKYNLEY